MKKNSLAYIVAPMMLLIASCTGNKDEINNKSSGNDILNQSKIETNGGPSTYFSKMTGSDENIPQIALILSDSSTDFNAASLELQPSLEDCKAFFKDETTAQKAFDLYTTDFKQKEILSKPAPGPVETVVAFANTEDLKKEAWSGKVKEIFPEGYHTAANIMKAGLKVFVIKFAEQNKSIIETYDGIAFVNGHWKIFPEPWRIKA
jgi:hypothetical protein